MSDTPTREMVLSEPPGDRMNRWVNRHLFGRTGYLPPGYSSVPKSMMLVIGWLRERFANVNIHAETGWVVAVADMNREGWDGNIIQAAGDTLPHAVCRAALLAALARG